MCPVRQVEKAGQVYLLMKKEYRIPGTSLNSGKDDDEVPQYLQLHQMVVRKIGEICRVVNQFIQPPGSPATEVVEFTLPQYSLPWLQAVAHYLRQNLLIFLHIPKYTESNMEHHFKHYFLHSSGLPDSDIYLYNKPGGHGTGGKASSHFVLMQSNDLVLWLSGNDHHCYILSAWTVSLMNSTYVQCFDKYVSFADSLLWSPTPPPSKDQSRLSSSGRGLPPLHFPPQLVLFDEALRDITVGIPIMTEQDSAGNMDTVARHGAQRLEIKAMERREMEKQLKIENLFVMLQQRSAQSNMPITSLRTFKKLPQIYREHTELGSKPPRECAERDGSREAELDLWVVGDNSSEFYSGGPQVMMTPGLFYTSPLFPLLASEVTSARNHILRKRAAGEGTLAKVLPWGAPGLGQTETEQVDLH
ncbi:Protein SZT2 [Acipenser ruthenus]|uniref:Protein SZT2 n=1 Tax=Acipenser ruthenus TaxID=7906 RepID=A0A444UIM7_ACIRT|nr:Protein SZT2 [Acipenser ruthenus]